MIIEDTDYIIKGTTKCECGYQFEMKDFTELKRLNIPGFYANQVKHFSPAKCPNCNKETLLLLKQSGQTYTIIDLAERKMTDMKEDIVEGHISQIEEEKEGSKEFVCPTCQKVCKSQLGLNAHIKTHLK